MLKRGRKCQEGAKRKRMTSLFWRLRNGIKEYQHILKIKNGIKERLHTLKIKRGRKQKRILNRKNIL